MTISVKKCDGGVPLPGGSSGTWFTWDTWDDEQGRSITRHRTEEEARMAAAQMTDEPRVRVLAERIIADGCSHTSILDALRFASRGLP